jgi:hypothetical protein
MNCTITNVFSRFSTVEIQKPQYVKYSDDAWDRQEQR